MARFELAFDQLSSGAQAVAHDTGFTPGARNPFRSIGIRAIEVLHACETALDLVERYERPDRPGGWREHEVRLAALGGLHSWTAWT